MYNQTKPTPDELPTTAQLLRSTIIALVAAVVILVSVVLPAEYGIDPTGAGNILGLTEMGEIKNKLADEAERDLLMDQEQSSLLDSMIGLFVGKAYAQESQQWRDEISFTLTPGEGIEWKLSMNEGETADYYWTTDGGRVNFDLHGDGGGKSISYEKGRGSTGEEGKITAAFTGKHGWFWRNRDSNNVTVTVQLRGDYSELKQTY